MFKYKKTYWDTEHLNTNLSERQNEFSKKIYSAFQKIKNDVLKEIETLQFSSYKKFKEPDLDFKELYDVIIVEMQTESLLRYNTIAYNNGEEKIAMIPKEVLTQLHNYVSELIKDEKEQFKIVLNNTITKAIEERQSLSWLKKEIAKIFEEGLTITVPAKVENGKIVRREYQRFIGTKQRANMIATTEYTRAWTFADEYVYKQNGIEHFIWRAWGANPCPYCLDNDGQVFSVNDLTVLIPAHVSCACTTTVTDLKFNETNRFMINEKKDTYQLIFGFHDSYQIYEFKKTDISNNVKHYKEKKKYQFSYSHKKKFDNIIEEGYYEYGYFKKGFKEIWINSNFLKGRFIFENKKFFKPKIQKPEILINEKIEDTRMAYLPKFWIDRIPEYLQWWKKKGDLNLLKMARQYVIQEEKRRLKNNIQNDFDFVILKIKNKIVEDKMTIVEKIKNSGLIGEKVEYFLEIFSKDKTFRFKLDSNPVFYKSMNAIKVDDNIKLSKSTDTVELIDRGKTQNIILNKNKYLFKLKGNLFNHTVSFIKTDDKYKTYFNKNIDYVIIKKIPEKLIGVKNKINNFLNETQKYIFSAPAPIIAIKNNKKFAKIKIPLKITGIALTEGTFTPSDGSTITFTPEIIKKYGEILTGVQLRLEHIDDDANAVVGWVTKSWAKKLSNGKMAIMYEALVYKYAVAELISKGKITGVSVGIILKTKPGKDNEEIVTEITKCEELSLTNTPACEDSTVET